jgi:dihydroorotase
MESHQITEANEQIDKHGMIIINGLAVKEGELTRTEIAVNSEGKITKLENLNRQTALIINARGKLIFPGAVDPHVHPRDGRQDYKEDWLSLSKAALAGGVTTALGMPNTDPFTDTAERLKSRLELAEKSLINYGEYIGSIGDNFKDLKSPFIQKNAAGIKVYLNDTTGGFTISPADTFKLAEKLCRTGNQLTFVLHAEGQTLNEIAPKLLQLGQRVHVAHISLASEVHLVEELQKKGLPTTKKRLPITAEVTPHHLLIAIDEIREKVRTDLCDLCVMKPPLSPKKDLPALYQGLHNGAIVAIATDHAPHTKAEKDANLAKGKPTYGVTGLQEMLPLMLTHLREHRLYLPAIANLISTSPAHHAKLQSRGEIKIGNWADLAIIDQNEQFQIGDKYHPLYSRAGWSIYQDWPVKGLVETTIVNGKIAYADGNFAEKSTAQQVRFNR